MPRILVVVCVAALSAGWSASLEGHPAVAEAAVDRAARGPVVSGHPLLRASLERMSRGSRLWRSAVTEIVRTGRTAVVLTPDQVVVAERAGDSHLKPFDPSLVAAVAPVTNVDAAVDAVMVVVNLDLLQEAHRRRGSLPAELDADVDRILAHEVYGHAMPYLIAGDLSGRCPDPRPGERATDACAIRRENAIRAELGLGRRTGYGLEGLALFYQPWGNTGD